MSDARQPQPLIAANAPTDPQTLSRAAGHNQIGRTVHAAAADMMDDLWPQLNESLDRAWREHYVPKPELDDQGRPKAGAMNLPPWVRQAVANFIQAALNVVATDILPNVLTLIQNDNPTPGPVNPAPAPPAPTRA